MVWLPLSNFTQSEKDAFLNVAFCQLWLKFVLHFLFGSHTITKYPDLRVDGTASGRDYENKVHE